MNLGEKIKALRKRRSLSQEELSSEIGINSNHLSRLERGKFQPSVDVLKRLSKTFDVSIDYLLSDDEETQPEINIENKTLTERVRLIVTLDPDDQLAIERVIDSMLTKQRMKKLLGETELSHVS